MEEDVETHLTSGEEAVVRLECVKQTSKDVEKEALAMQNPLVSTVPKYNCYTRFCGWFKTIVSIVAHLGITVSLVVVIWSREADKADASKEYYNHYLISSLFTGFFYIVILVEAASCDTYSYIRNFSRHQTADEYIERVRDARPLIRWYAECYHYEVQTQTSMQRDHKGRMNVRQLRHKEKVVSHKEHEGFRYNKWRDLSRDIKSLLNARVTRIECSKVFIFKDERSKENYMEQYIAFREKNRRRDEFMEHKEIFQIPGFADKFTCPTQSHEFPCWVREVWFWLFSMSLLTWVYRWLFRHLSTKIYVIFIKELEV